MAPNVAVPDAFDLDIPAITDGQLTAANVRWCAPEI
jgi:hypothetical protein